MNAPMLQIPADLPKKRRGRQSHFSQEDQVSIARRYYVDGLSATEVAAEFAEFSSTSTVSPGNVVRIAQGAFKHLTPAEQKAARKRSA